MAWFSRGIPLGIWQSRRQWNILNTLIKTWITNLSVGFEYNCWQQEYWPQWPRYDPVSSFAIFPVISHIIGSDPWSAWNVIAATASDFNQIIFQECVLRPWCLKLINSLSPGRYGSNFKCISFKLIIQHSSFVYTKMLSCEYHRRWLKKSQQKFR